MLRLKDENNKRLNACVHHNACSLDVNVNQTHEIDLWSIAAKFCVKIIQKHNDEEMKIIIVQKV